MKRKMAYLIAGRIAWGIAVFSFLSIFFIARMVAAEEYGYKLSEDELCSIWWAEGAYKVMPDDPVPSSAGPGVDIKAARNEYEPFLLVLHPKSRMDRVRVRTGNLASESGSSIASGEISICHVEYVNVTVPTDGFGKAGKWPDPLPPYEGAFTAYPGENHALWITVHIPPETAPGIYSGSIVLRAGAWEKKIPLRLTVWNFALPGTLSLRSGFGLSSGLIRQYHNLETEEELDQVFDLYMKNFREHRLCPYQPYLTPMKVEVTGLFWKGGEFISDGVHGGRFAAKAEDNSVSENEGLQYARRVPVKGATAYSLLWHSRTPADGQEYTAEIKCYNAEGTYLYALNKLMVYKGTATWKADTLRVRDFSPEVETVGIHLYPVFRDYEGSEKGTAFFDDIIFRADDSPVNLLTDGDFEFDFNKLSVAIDFSGFDAGAERYLGEYGFNSFRLALYGMAGGTFYSQNEGIFAGFRQGTPEYDRLFGNYLQQVQDHLEENGWLGKEFVYWFDEPNEKDYPFVREGMIRIRKGASKLTRFITEHQPGPDIMDVSEVSCTIFHRVEPDIVADLVAKGREFWSYLCTGPKGPWVTLFIDHPAVNLRMWLWMTYQYRMKGILVWQSNYWSSPAVFPRNEPQNPWEDPMSYTSSYGTAYGRVRNWGNGDGRFLYPPNRDPLDNKTKYLCGPINSIRWEILREGVEDYEYFMLLEKSIAEAGLSSNALAGRGKELLNFPKTIFEDGKTYTKDPKILLEYRSRIAEVLNGMSRENR